MNKRYLLAGSVVLLAVLPSLPLRLAAAAVVVAVLVFPHEREQVPQAEEDFSPRFSRFRHDLLNDLQLVYGFVQLNKPAQEVLQRVDRVIARLRIAGLMFNIQNWDLSCRLFDIWEEAELKGIRLKFQASGKWTGFDKQWSSWSDGLLAVWAYYKGLAEATGLTEVVLELNEGPLAWQIKFSAPLAPVAGATLPKKLDIQLGSGAKLIWNHPEHSILLQVQKGAEQIGG